MNAGMPIPSFANSAMKISKTSPENSNTMECRQFFSKSNRINGSGKQV
jgi:hypothetical protein